MLLRPGKFTLLGVIIKFTGLTLFHSLYLFELIKEGRDNFIKDVEGWLSGDSIFLSALSVFNQFCGHV